MTTTDHRYIILPGRDTETVNAYWALRRLMAESLKSISSVGSPDEVLTAHYRGYMVRFIQSEDGVFSVRFSNYALPQLRAELREKVGYNA